MIQKKEITMIKKISLTVFMILVVIAVCFAGANMKEGLYEITSKIEMTDMPMDMPPMTFKQCLTKDNLVPKGNQSGQECEHMDVKVSGSTVTWVMKCTDANGTTTGKGKITYKGDTFSGVINIKVNNPGQPPMDMINKMTGKRIGSCN